MLQGRILSNQICYKYGFYFCFIQRLGFYQIYSVHSFKKIDLVNTSYWHSKIVYMHRNSLLLFLKHISKLLWVVFLVTIICDFNLTNKGQDFLFFYSVSYFLISYFLFFCSIFHHCYNGNDFLGHISFLLFLFLHFIFLCGLFLFVFSCSFELYRPWTWLYLPLIYIYFQSRKGD